MFVQMEFLIFDVLEVLSQGFDMPSLVDTPRRHQQLDRLSSFLEWLILLERCTSPGWPGWS
jgi:hypothetical protein